MGKATRIVICLTAMMLTVGTAGATFYVEVPADLTVDDILHGDSALFDRLVAHGYRQYKVAYLNKGFTGDEAMVFTKNGVRIDDEPALKKKGETDSELHFYRGTYPPPTEEWEPFSETEYEELRTHIYDAISPGVGAYYVGKRVFGEPFSGDSVYIFCDPTQGGGGLYIELPVVDDYLLLGSLTGEVTPEMKGTFNHEMCHGITNCHPDNNVFAEGMNTAVEVIIQSILYDEGVERDYEGANHGGTSWDAEYYSYQEFYNRPEFAAAMPGTFWCGDMYLTYIRYQIAGNAWWKVYAEDHDFFTRYTDSLEWNPYATYAECVEMAENAYSKPTIEGMAFDKWFEDQPILNPNPNPNPYEPLEVLAPLPYRTPYGDSGQAYFYRRQYWYGGFYTEEPIAGAAITVRKYDFADAFVELGDYETTGDGFITYDNPYHETKLKRYRVECRSKAGGGVVNAFPGHADERRVGVPGRWPTTFNDVFLNGVLYAPGAADSNLYFQLYDLDTGESLASFSTAYPCPEVFNQFSVNATELFGPTFNADDLPPFMQWRITYETENPPYEITWCRNVDKATYFFIFNAYPGDEGTSTNGDNKRDKNAETAVGELATYAAVTPAGITINYVIPDRLAAKSRVSLEVYDLAGRKLKTVDLGVAEEGKHAFTWDYDVGGRAAAPGVYLYRITAGGESAQSKIAVTY